MNHFATIALVAAALTAGAGAAHAKPTVAVLGLEVIDDGSSVDKQSTQIARDLTEAMRSVPRQGGGPYGLAAGGNKDFIELKLLFGCAQETKECLVRIGHQISADYLMYGNIARGGASYVVTVKLYSVQDRSIEKVFSDVIPSADLKGESLTTWGKRVYEQLTATRDASGPSLADGHAATTTPSTTGIAGTGGAEGTSVDSGRGTSPSDASKGAAGAIILDERTQPKRSTSGGKTARVVFYASVAVAVGASAGAIYYGLDVGNREDQLRDAILAYRATPGNATAFPPEQSACSNTPSDATAVRDACAAGDRSAKRANLGWTIAGVAAVSAGVFAYLGWRAPKAARETAPKAGIAGTKDARRSKSTWAITPVLSPHNPGAALTVQF